VQLLVLKAVLENQWPTARDKPGRFLAAEGLVAGAAGLGAGIAQDAAPYDETARLYGELIGSLVIPIPAQLAR
jgi:hypothetical protein